LLNKLETITKPEIDSLVVKSKIPIRLSCITPSGWPCVLSLWYVCKNGKIYCASQKSSKIIQYLQHSNKVAFEIASDDPPYRGVRGRGTVNLLGSLGACILDVLIEKYIVKDSSLSYTLKQKSDDEIAIEITPQKFFTYDYSKRMKNSF